MKSNEILDIINPPNEIISIEHINDLVNDEKCLTLIERPFFLKIKWIIEEICKNNIEGDIVCIGVFKGGASLYLKSLFEEYGIHKKLWLIDSFSGFNDKNTNHFKDNEALKQFSKQIKMSNFPTLNSVKELFVKYQLYNNVNLIEGFLEDLVSKLTISKIALLHIDVDFFEPTYLSLKSLYKKLSEGGWVIIDDYNADIFNCKEAVDKYRLEKKINDSFEKLGKYPIGWKKNYKIKSKKCSFSNVFSFFKQIYIL